MEGRAILSVLPSSARNAAQMPAPAGWRRALAGCYLGLTRGCGAGQEPLQGPRQGWEGVGIPELLGFKSPPCRDDLWPGRVPLPR